MYIVGLTTFLIVLGLSLAVFITRVFNVIIAAIYTIGASVLRALFRAPLQ